MRLVEVLSFDGCPNVDAAVALVERVLSVSGVGAEVRRVNVPDTDAAVEHRFLGSPTIRVDGRDIEPGAEERDSFVHACRVYRTPTGLRGQPDEAWLLNALGHPRSH